MATPNPASEFSGEGNRNVPRLDCPLVSDPKYFDTCLNFFYINYCNIRGSVSNFQSVDDHLSSIFFYSPKYSCLRDPPLCAERVTEVIVFGMEAILFLNFNLLNLGLTQPVLVLYMIERLPTKGT
ncbi:hypothetical protein E2C01_056249 [Portunus trituberculatus]|uniref:Uncharacterized protein n=1 Tax=Portunus trituberculatus TaxID=210409 RepID=A0A5B7GX25_PORTR|nr:hypothetical protein [Portunus trituberculatus]